jgi:hypothetical protein
VIKVRNPHANMMNSAAASKAKGNCAKSKKSGRKSKKSARVDQNLSKKRENHDFGHGFLIF